FVFCRRGKRGPIRSSRPALKIDANVVEGAPDQTGTIKCFRTGCVEAVSCSEVRLDRGQQLRLKRGRRQRYAFYIQRRAHINLIPLGRILVYLFLFCGAVVGKRVTLAAVRACLGGNAGGKGKRKADYQQAGEQCSIGQGEVRSP